jgi:predicted nucleic acid-binding protein
MASASVTHLPVPSKVAPFGAGAYAAIRMRYSPAVTEPRVYVETTIPSFYHDVRTEPDIVARRGWTRRWWATATGRYELVTSAAVLDEVVGGSRARGKERLALLRELPILPVEPAISEIVQAYIRHRVMPADPGGDALHLALASLHKCDFLVTWNCQHLANANKFGHIRRVNTMLGLFVPALVTPLELLGGRDEEEERSGHR